jgi:hypothetical protein
MTISKLFKIAIPFMAITLLFGCSSGVDNEDPYSQNEDEVITEEEDPVDSEEPKIGIIPFNVSVIGRDSNNSGPYYLSTFISGDEEPESPINLNESFSFSNNSLLSSLTKKDVLFRVDGSADLLRINLEDFSAIEGTIEEFFEDPGDCYYYPTSMKSADNRILSYTQNDCLGTDYTSLLSFDLNTDTLLQIDYGPEVTIGGGYYDNFISDNYAFISYKKIIANTNNELEVLDIYELQDFSKIYTYEASKISFAVDNELLFILNPVNHSFELLDLNERNILKSGILDSSLFIGSEIYFDSDFINQNRFNYTDISSKKITLTSWYYGSGRIPAIYDFDSGQISTISPLNGDDLLPSNLVGIDYRTDLETESSCFLYADLNGGGEVSYGVMFMDFEGKILFESSIPFFPEQLTITD